MIIFEKYSDPFGLLDQNSNNLYSQKYGKDNFESVVAVGANHTDSDYTGSRLLRGDSKGDGDDYDDDGDGDGDRKGDGDDGDGDPDLA